MKVTVKASTVFLAAAEFSSDRLHRYRLDRAWDLGNARRLVVIGLNPSTADELVDDPTIRRVTDTVKHEEFRIGTVPYWKTGIGVEIVSACSCGARWTHPPGRSEEEKDSIFDSHVKYFERTTVVL